jgi:hypothetical protein
LKSVNGKNDFIVILRNANGVRNTFAHRITDTLELSASIPLIIKKRTGLRGNGDDSTELIEYRNTRTFSLPELKEYTKELTSIIYTLIELCKELQIK